MASSTRCCKFQPSLRKPLQEGPMSPLLAPHLAEFTTPQDPITYVTAHDWQGHVVGEYPVNIQNGQWAIFEHVGTRGPQCQGSVAAVVYNIQDCCDTMVAWNNPWKTASGGNNTAYCEMKDPGYYDDCSWCAIRKKLKASGTENRTSMEGYATKVSIDTGSNTPTYSAIFYLDVDP
ncbi:hypothetical protein HanXRQr2_Chr03g0130911 [Helianthus annuus]|nr:hypothetical protein HanXRQr2_Chr03g0130911 [Helianthus annuus]KAJ0594470.1 hypothetical protein HanHA300_Chr03g0108901 [Helianthus annuus]KAJ0609510.1 hypothetical protein HanHA89_Chr03g0120781 [Helianthus annuus]KAJ0769562.1 hypothetical protein HanLR1_Chr03g0114141 [Helianthus annuus]KAJ0945401.1 hypothetical protein HanPSC8_Chr03g0127731 [Helianthus annuus]